jgi:hypothetical protein
MGKCILILVIGATAVAAAAGEDNFSAFIDLDPEIAQAYGNVAAHKFTKDYQAVQFHVEPNVDKAVALFNPTINEGIIAIPLKGWRELPDAKQLAKERGIPMCLLMMSASYVPVIDGRPVATTRLRKLKLHDWGGNEHAAFCLLCSLQRVGDRELQVCIYGTEKEPLIRAPWRRWQAAPQGDLSLAIEDPKGDQASLVVGGFGKFGASIAIRGPRD